MKRQADTARDVYHEMQPTLQGRQLFVRDQLAQCITLYGNDPTALELLRFVSAQFPQRSYDVNTVRPRLFELDEQGWARHSGKRVCSVSGKTVYTWGLATPRPPAVPPKQIAMAF